MPGVQKLDLHAVIKDSECLETDSQGWCRRLSVTFIFKRAGCSSDGCTVPATYRIRRRRGGAGDQPDSASRRSIVAGQCELDKARRLLWPIKQKDGRKI